MPAAPDPRAPIGDTQADALLAPLAGFAHLAIGVSGGPDSTALLHLLHRWRARTAGALRLTALTVDHGLRPEAAREAQETADLCARLGIPHKTLSWTGEKPRTGIQARARAARRWLLAEGARDAGAEALVLAHHLDDQAETFLIRLSHGSQIFGLAGMRPQGAWYGLPVLRPLLGVPKMRLLATLQANCLSWIEDPSNEDAGYERVRYRQLMPALAREGFTAARLAEAASLFGRAADAIDARVTTVLDRAEIHPAGPVRLELDALGALPETLLHRALARLIRFASGSDYMPGQDKLARAAAGILASGEAKRTLGGTVIARKGAMLHLWREPGREALAALDLSGPSRGIFDNRFLVTAGKGSGLRVGPLGRGGLKKLGLAAPKGWPAAAFEAAPLILSNDATPYIPGFGDGSLPPSFSILRLQSLSQP